MKSLGKDHATWQKAVVLTLFVIVLFVIAGSVVMALLYPNLTTDYEFLRVPTLTPPFP